jgi:hypothetical protein
MSTSITVSPLRQRMIEDMVARKLGSQSQRSHIYSCKRFAAFLKRSLTRRQPTTFAAFNRRHRHRPSHSREIRCNCRRRGGRHSGGMGS